MSIWFWKVLDHPVVENCLGRSLALAGLIGAVVLLPEDSGAEHAAVFFALFTTLSLIWELLAAPFRRR